jgi:isopenicillin N synthase-like dioxygenase
MPSSVSTVDIAALFGPAGPDRDATDAALWQGLRDTGAVIITGHPEADGVDARARAMLALFDAPEAVRAPLFSRMAAPENANWYRGYHPRAPERLLQNDFYDMGPVDPAPGPALEGMEIFCEATPLPDKAVLPGWAATMRAYYDHMNTVSQAMIRSIGRSAGFDEDMIRARFDGDHSTLRLLDYKPGAKSPMRGDDGADLSAGLHTDASGLSLLWQQAPGLQAQGQDGVHRDIPMVPNAISVHVGDVMTRLTDGAVPATPHRVLASDRARRSIGFFLEPALTAPVTAAARTSDPVPVQDTYGWQLLETFARRPAWSDVFKMPVAG